MNIEHGIDFSFLFDINGYISYFADAMMPLVAISSFFITLFGMPSLIKVAKLKRLVDEPEDPRKVHVRSVPSIGGVMIFIAIMVNGFFWVSMGTPPDQETFRANSILAACAVIIFFMGLKDDIIGMSAAKKLLIHIGVGMLMITVGGFKIDSFGGLFGIETLPESVALLFSLFVYIVVVNAWNLIDGLDGLAGGYSIISMSAFALWFIYTGQTQEAVMSLSMAGAMLGFLVFNFAPARIFLGDCGSLMTGLFGFALATRLIATPNDLVPESWGIVSRPILAMAILAYPMIDTLRVFFMRAISGISPFHPDRNHLHHRLMMHYNNHAKSVIYIYVFTIGFISLAWVKPFLYPKLNEEEMFFGLLLLAGASFFPILMKTRKDHLKVKKEAEEQVKKKNKAIRNKSTRNSLGTDESALAQL